MERYRETDRIAVDPGLHRDDGEDGPAAVQVALSFRSGQAAPSPRRTPGPTAPVSDVERQRSIDVRTACG